MGAKKRVPLHQNPRGFVEVDPTATEGAILGVNLRDSAGNIIRPQDVLNQSPSGGGTNSIASTIWRLIREIPANIQKLAALVGKGIAVRRDDGEWALRTLQGGAGIDIANPDGEAGDPTISLEDLANSGVGTALVKITRDAKGRVSGTQAASTTDLPEGTNLYFTNARASAAAPVQSVNARIGTVAVPDFVIKATPPMAADFGRPIIEGDRWFNSTNGVQYSRVGGAWVYDNAASLSRYMPAFLASGASSPVPLNADGTVPAFLADGSSSPFATQA